MDRGRVLQRTPPPPPSSPSPFSLLGELLECSFQPAADGDAGAAPLALVGVRRRAVNRSKQAITAVLPLPHAGRLALVVNGGIR